MATLQHKDLIKAIKSGNEEALTKFYETNEISTLLHTRDNKGRQALHIACKSRKAKLLTNLIKNGADIFA